MANGWTPERRARQSEAIQRWRPWDSTKGPATPEGKARSAMRGYKGNPRGSLRAARLIVALIEADARALASASQNGT